MPTVDQSYDPAVPLDALTPSPVNPNESDVGAISTSIEANGFYGAVLASRDGTIIAGEHRWRAAAAVGEPSVPVLYLSVDAPTARRILLADNRTAELARRDEAKLADLLRSVVEDAGSVDALIGTGYDGDDLDQLLADIGDADDHWYGPMKLVDGSRATATVYFRTQEDADRCFELLGVPRRTVFWWPPLDNPVEPEPSGILSP